MTPSQESLKQILSLQLTAVNQQFTHILALRRWGLAATAKRIAAVDYVDFPVAMKIIDYLVASDVALDMQPPGFAPGACEQSILRAEQDLERRYLKTLQEANVADAYAASLVAEALAPRQDYAAWLSLRLAGDKDVENPPSAAALSLGQVFARLIAIIQQAMVHAFLQHRWGEIQNADAAWATSGAAMMHATRMVNTLADLDAAPLPRTSYPLVPVQDPAAANELDRAMARDLAASAAEASEETEGEIRDLCLLISSEAHEIAGGRLGGVTRVPGTTPSAFKSFEATLARFVRA